MASIDLAVASPTSSSTSVSQTVAPSLLNSRASSAPWPRAAPVIKHTFPSSLPIVVSVCRLVGCYRHGRITWRANSAR